MFYVYEHWRPDTNMPFYVGKGQKKRAYDLKRRKKHHLNIQNKLKFLGLDVEIRIIEENLSEIAAFRLEQSRISMWRHIGYKLTNLTNGGDGIQGFKHSDQTRKKMSESALLANTPEVRLKKSKSMLGLQKTEEHKRKLSLANYGNKNASGKRAPDFGKKISAALKGKKLTTEHIANRTASLRRNNALRRAV